MFIKNDMSKVTIEGAVAVKGWVFLVTTRIDKNLFLVKQTGQRSWDAFNIDIETPYTPHIHGNRTNILALVREEMGADIQGIFQFYTKTALRKAVMEFQAYGTIGEQAFVVERR